MNIITVANKIDMSYDFHIKHNMHARERKIFSMVNKNKKMDIRLLEIGVFPSIENWNVIVFDY